MVSVSGLTRVHNSIVDELSEFEKQVVNKHDLIEMRGKVSIIYFSIRKIEREKALAVGDMIVRLSHYFLIE